MIQIGLDDKVDLENLEKDEAYSSEPNSESSENKENEVIQPSKKR